MNPLAIATAEAYIDATVDTIKQCMEKGLPHDKIIEITYSTLRQTCNGEADMNEANKYMCVLLARAMYHLTNLQIQNRN